MLSISPAHFEPQNSKFNCGAACLTMVYRSFGLSADQSAIGQEVCGRARYAKTHVLAQHALRQGLLATIVQCRFPWRVLLPDQLEFARVILSRRLDLHSLSGHFTVLVELGHDLSTFYDPFHGPNLRLRRHELALTWGPRPHSRGTVGFVLIALTQGRSAWFDCPVCKRAVPGNVVCQRCNEPIPLSTSQVIGCLDTHCPGRLWETLFCPQCDMPHRAVTAPSVASAPPAFLPLPADASQDGGSERSGP